MPSDRDNEDRAARIDNIVWEQRAQSDGPRTHSLPSGKGEHLLMRIERLRQQAQEFQGTVESELRTTRALLEDLRVRQAKRRGHGRRVD
jgi:hypothetical protein